MDAKQDNNRRWTQMKADKGTAGKLGRADVRSRRSRRSRRFLGLLTSGFIALSALAAPVDPVGQLRSEVDQVLGIAYSGQSSGTVVDRVRPLLEKDFTFEVVTRQAIGPGWRQFSPSEQQKVTDLFSRLVIRIYAARVVGTQRPNITYGKTVPLAPDRCEIPTRVTAANGDRPYSVVYRLINLSSSWRIYDVLIEGVSFVANYRAQFDELVQHGGAAAVIKTLEAKLAEPINPNS
jgi:phospholipid transport system substrate-binding protein